MHDVQKLAASEVSAILKEPRPEVMRSAPPAPVQPLVDQAWLLDVAKRRASLVLSCLAAGLALAVLYLLVTPPLYTASLRLLVESQTPKINAMQQLTPDLGPIDAAVLGQVEVLRSPRMSEMVIRHLKLHPAAIAPPIAGSAPGSNQLPADVIEAFAKRLSVSRVDPTSIIQISYSHTDPEMAKTITNTMASLYLQDQVSAKNATTMRAIEWLRRRVGDLREEVRTSSNQLEAFKAEHNLYRLGQMTLGERVLSASSDQLIAARTSEAAALVRLQQMQRLAENPGELEKSGHALQSDTLREFRKQHAEITRRRANVVSRFGNQHPDVANADAELKALDRQIALEMNRIIDSSRTDYEAAKAQVALLEKNLTQVKDVLSEDNQFAIKLNELERQSQATAALYQTLLNRLKETESQETLNAPDARVINYASTPLSPTHPRKSLVLILALLASAGIGVALALALEAVAPAFWNASDVERTLGFRHLATLPSLDPADRVPQAIRVARASLQRARQASDRLRTMIRQALGLAAAPTRQGDATQKAAAGRTLLRPMERPEASAFTEAVFAVKCAVEAFREDRPRAVIAVVSAVAGEGKTTLAVNLADYLATNGTSTLLIDADLRDSALSKELAADATTGLATAVVGRTGFETATVTDPASGLVLLAAPAQPTRARPMDVLSAPQMSELIAKAGDAYGVVLLDTAALSRFIDTRALLKAVDAVIVVIAHGATTQETARSVLKAADLPADKVLGVVLNKAV